MGLIKEPRDDFLLDVDTEYSKTVQNTNLHGRVVEIAGVRIAGLGGIFQGEIWDPAQAPQYDSYQAYCAREYGRHRRRGAVQSILQGRALRHLHRLSGRV